MTKKEFHELEITIDKLIKSAFKRLITDLRSDLKDLRYDLKEISDENKENGKKLEGIQKNLDKFISILNRFSKKQAILEAKMKLIEEYFNPHPHN